MVIDLGSKKLLGALAVVLYLALTHFGKQLHSTKNEKLIQFQIDEWQDSYAKKEDYQELDLKIKKHKHFGPILEVKGFVPEPIFLSDVKEWLRLSAPPFKDLDWYEENSTSPSFFIMHPLLVDYKVYVEN